MDAWGAFYKATGRAATVVLGASRLLTNAIFQPPLAENWGTVEANRLSGSVSCASGTRRSPASDSSFERVSGSMQIYIYIFGVDGLGFDYQMALQQIDHASHNFK